MESVTEFASSGYQYLGARRVAGRVEVLLHWPGRVTRCRGCGSESLHSHGLRERRASHLPVGEMPCDLLVQFRRFRCTHCRTAQSPELPLLAPRVRLSEQLRDFVRFLFVRLKLSFLPMQRWLGIGWNTLRRCVPAPPAPLLEASEMELRHLCLDEVFFREPRRYLTVLSCASGRVLGLAEGRGARPSRELLLQLPPSRREAVETLATDLSLGQRQAAMACLPSALICADHFHVARLIRRSLREAPAMQKAALRPPLSRLRTILRGDCPHALGRWLDEWSNSKPAGLESLYGTIENWQLEIEAAIETKQSTGPAEALNRRIALLRRLACGYTNLNNFTQRILWLNFSSHHQC